MATVRHKDFLSVGIPKVFTGATTLALNITATRFLTPAAFGVLNLCLTSLLLFDGLIGSALDIGVLRHVTRAGARLRAGFTSLEQAAVFLKILAGAALGLIAAAFGEVIGARLFHQPGGRMILLTLVASGTGLLLMRSVQVNIQVHSQFRRYGFMEVSYNSLRIALVAVILLGGSASPLSLLGCYAFAPILPIVVFFMLQRAGQPARVWRFNLQKCRDLLHGSSLPLLTFSLSTTVSRSDLFFLALLGRPSDLGIYGAAATVAVIPEIVASYLAPVLLPRILTMESAGTFLSFFRRFHTGVFAVCGTAAAVGVFFSEPLLRLVFPLKYQASIYLITILLPGTLATATFFPLTLNFLMLRRPRTFLLCDSCLMLPLFLAYALLIPTRGAVGVAWATTVFRVTKSIVVQWAAYRMARRSHREFEVIKDSHPATASSG